MLLRFLDFVRAEADDRHHIPNPRLSQRQQTKSLSPRGTGLLRHLEGFLFGMVVIGPYLSSSREGWG